MPGVPLVECEALPLVARPHASMAAIYRPRLFGWLRQSSQPAEPSLPGSGRALSAVASTTIQSAHQHPCCLPVSWYTQVIVVVVCHFCVAFVSVIVTPMFRRRYMRCYFH